MSEEPVTVGVLSLHNSKETKAICNAVEALGHEPEWFRRENTAVSVEDGEVSLEPDVDIVANRMLLTNTEEPAEGLGLAATRPSTSSRPPPRSRSGTSTCAAAPTTRKPPRTARCSRSSGHQAQPSGATTVRAK